MLTEAKKRGMPGNKKLDRFVFIYLYGTENNTVSMKQKPIDRQGFTLIEVLIAMVILATSVASLMAATAQCMSVIGRARKLETARGLLARVDAENPILSVDMEEGHESGEFDDMEGYTWSREIVMDDEENRPGLFVVTTRVAWSEKSREAFEEVITYKYCPDAESVTSEF
ncbi:MAG: prepilin-type N-terminal cleavage/methylation domain-containing protein [Pontiellaceae bacterium]|nr:prepilin-type N-terminal cleavage/methylation domain-containing protein [Pontiellaceae bacterium]